MERGAVVMMDALGFKGIWNRHKGVDLLQELKSLRTEAEAAVDRSLGGASQRRGLARDETNALSNVTIEFLSDTIVICVAPKCDADSMRVFGGETSALALSSYVAGLLASEVMQIAAQSWLGLAYRGTISIGEFHVEPSIILGSAIDEAAEHMDHADGAFVWMLPSAAQTLWEHCRPIDGFPLIRYPVPLKGGCVIETLVVAPFGPKTSDEQRQQIERGIDRSFRAGTSLGVEIKRQNTMRFIEHCRANLGSPNHRKE